MCEQEKPKISSDNQLKSREQNRKVYKRSKLPEKSGDNVLERRLVRQADNRQPQKYHESDQMPEGIAPKFSITKSMISKSKSKVV